MPSKLYKTKGCSKYRHFLNKYRSASVHETRTKGIHLAAGEQDVIHNEHDVFISLTDSVTPSPTVKLDAQCNIP